jgi:hypothetical protein
VASEPLDVRPLARLWPDATPDALAERRDLRTPARVDHRPARPNIDPPIRSPAREAQHVSEAVICLLKVAALSRAGQAELAKRVKDGEPAKVVEAELLIREGKVVRSPPVLASALKLAP